MKKFTTSAVFALLFAATSAFAGYQDFTLVNNTGSAIMVVQMSQTGNCNWEEDVLGNEVIESGESVLIPVNGYAERFWDVRIVYFGSKPAAEYFGLDLATIGTLVLTDNWTGGTTLSSF